MHLREGQLYTVNRGPDALPGFPICARCGRFVDTPAQTHQRPTGSRLYGPRPGSTCECRDINRVILVHDFRSDVVLLGVALATGMHADATDSVGRAVWLSLGTALLHASSTYLQIDPDELAMGIRPWMREDGRLHAEIFLYDTLPNGAGYAQEIAENIDFVMERAWILCSECSDRSCQGACYRCLLDYTNQRYHAQLDRFLALDVINFIREGQIPTLSFERQLNALSRLQEILLPGFDLQVDIQVENTRVPGIFTTPQGERSLLWPIHTLLSATQQQEARLTERTGMRPIFLREFDLLKRPVWVWDQII